MVITGKQRHTCWCTKSCSVKAVILQPVIPKLVHCRCGNESAKRFGYSETHIVNQDNDNVRCPFRSFYFKPRRWSGIPYIQLLIGWTDGLFYRKHSAVNTVTGSCNSRLICFLLGAP